MEHRTVAARTSAEAVAFDDTLETAAFGDTDYIDDLFGLEVLSGDLVASLEVTVAAVQFELATITDPVRASTSCRKL
jgi:hypothetical protein